MSIAIPNPKSRAYPDFSRHIALGEGDKVRQEENARLRGRDLDNVKFNAYIGDDATPQLARYMGTRRKDGWHYMEIRIHASAQVRRYVRPDRVTWRFDPPEIKWGDKMKDFL